MIAHPTVADEWTAREWRAYRAQQVRAVERFGEPWASITGRPLVAMADWHLRRLAA